MPEKYVHAILKFLASRNWRPMTEKQLARLLGVTPDEYGTFRAAVKQLRDSGRIVLGARDALLPPGLPERVVGRFTQNPRGFGFVTPEPPTVHADLFIPPDQTGGAMTGDLVVARVTVTRHRDGRTSYAGKIVKILQRARNRFVGTLQKAGRAWFVIPEGSAFFRPIVVRDISSASPPEGSKLVVEILNWGESGELPTGVIVETLGKGGLLEVETLAVIRSYGFPEKFSRRALQVARSSARGFSEQLASVRKERGRLDITELPTITIDPPDARDFDDAVSMRRTPDGGAVLGVHIADVAQFVPEGSPLDEEACNRGTSVYFPRKVLPMLPEILSNGVCSLQEDQERFAVSVFITYDRNANVTKTEVAETIVRSDRRLTYKQAQQIIDGDLEEKPQIVELLRDLCDLAKRIEARRKEAGMLHLDLPEVELLFDSKGRVYDAVPADTSYTHTMIEMFMVEANEAVARLLAATGRPFLRRIHPPPDPLAGRQLAAFAGAAGWRISRQPDRKELQKLLESVKGTPESFAVNLAVLRTFQRAEYSPIDMGHYALASDCYCHFTSPIRRYPDLTIHRLVKAWCRGRFNELPPADLEKLKRLGEAMTEAEQTAEAAEEELREVLVLQFLEGRIGETFGGIVTGVAGFGIFVQSPRFLIEGVVALEDLGDDWWEVNARYGFVRGERTGRTFRIGQVVEVQVAAVDVAHRQLHLRLVSTQKKSASRKKSKKEKKRKKKKRSAGKRYKKR